MTSLAENQDYFKNISFPSKPLFSNASVLFFPYAIKTDGAVEEPVELKSALINFTLRFKNKIESALFQT